MPEKKGHAWKHYQRYLLWGTIWAIVVYIALYYQSAQNFMYFSLAVVVLALIKDTADEYSIHHGGDSYGHSVGIEHLPLVVYMWIIGLYFFATQANMFWIIITTFAAIDSAWDYSQDHRCCKI